MLFIIFFPFLAALISFLAFRIFGFSVKQSLYKQKSKYAKTIADAVVQMDISSTVKSFVSAEQVQKMQPNIEQMIEQFLNEKLQKKLPVVAMFAGDKLMVQAKEIVVEEVMQALPNLINNYTESNLNNEAIAQKIESGIINMPHDNWEYQINTLLKPILNKITFASIGLGFVLGIVFILLIFVYNWIYLS